MKKKLIPLVLSVIAVISSCGETTNKPESGTPTLQSTTVSEAESETIAETTTTTIAETTTTTETTTTAPLIEPIVEHEMLTMQEAFIKVVENDAQEKVKEIVEYSDEIPFKVAVTENGNRYVFIDPPSTVNKKLYDNDVLIDVSDVHVLENEWYDCKKSVELYNEKYRYSIFDSEEELTLSDLLSRYFCTDIKVESIEGDAVMNTCTINCNCGIKFYCVGLLYPDTEHLYQVDENDSFTIIDTMQSDTYDAQFDFFVKSINTNQDEIRKNWFNQ